MQVSWIDPKDVALLAESLRTPPPSQPAPVEAGGGSLLDDGDIATLGRKFEDWRDESVAEGDTEDLHETEAPEAPPSGDAPARPEAAPMPGPEPGPDLHAFRQRLQAIRERAVDAGLLPPPSPVEQITEPSSSPAEERTPAPTEDSVVAEAPVSAFEVPLGSMMGRLEAFASWSDRRLGLSEIFVVDDQGNLLWGAQDQAGLVLSTLMAINAATRSNASSAWESAQVIERPLASGSVLTVMPCPTRMGIIQVAVVGPEALEQEKSALVREALIATMDAEA